MLQFEFRKIKAQIRDALTHELPGEKAHRLLLPRGRELNPKTDIATLQSSVLMLLFPIDDQINTCLIRRPATMRNHAGQIAFPGGRYENSDQDLIQTALRESNEETGTDSSNIEILGALTPLYVQVSNFTINPFIGWTDKMPDFKIDKREVDELVIIPIDQFSHHSSSQLREVSTIYGVIEVPGFYIDELFIWGATAMIISEFNELYKPFRKD